LIKQQRAIVNGTLSLAYPAVGTLTMGRVSFCSGALISPRAVLTAAHCINSASFQQQKIEFRIDIPLDGRRFRSVYAEVDQAKSQAHPDYKQEENNAGLLLTLENDIAVVALKTPIHEVSPLPLNKQKIDETWLGRTVEIWGYGKISYLTSLTSPHKYKASLKIDKLGATIGSRVIPNTLRLTSEKSSPCQGDSGGPYLMQLNGSQHIVAVHSFGNALCVGVEGAFRVDAYSDWIVSVVNALGVCQRDDDCGSCAMCREQACMPKPFALSDVHCSACRSDADCGDLTCVALAEGRRCLQPCLGACCPVGHVCSGQGNPPYCVPESGLCPNLNCQTDEHCSETEICVQNQCLLVTPKRQSDVCQPCTDDAECADGGLCYLPETGGGRCLQACTPYHLCPEGFLCKALSPSTYHCVPADGLCFAACTNNSDCRSGMICSEGLCQRADGGERGEPCFGKAPCREGLECLPSLDGARCAVSCGFPPGSAGAACGNASGNQFYCEKGLICASNPLGGRLCVQHCKTNEQCVDGGTCMPFIGYCICQSNDNCAEGSRCNEIISGIGVCTTAKVRECAQTQICNRGAANNACLDTSNGTQGLGQTCSLFRTCRDGLQCVPGINICVEVCTESEICKFGGKCSSVPLLADRYCICDNEADCAEGWPCRAFASILTKRLAFCIPEFFSPCHRDIHCPHGLLCHKGRCYQAHRLPEIPNEQAAEEQTTDGGSDEYRSAEYDEAQLDESQFPDEQIDATIAIDIFHDQENKLSPDNIIGELPIPTSACACHISPSVNNSSIFIVFLYLLWLVSITVHNRSRPR
jgi:hypothetical protein